MSTLGVAGKIKARWERARQGLWPATLILLLASGLRVFRLDDQNIWWDEGWTLWMARMQPVGIAWRTAADSHPPLHYLLMHYWTQLGGASAFSGRLLSALAGMLMVALGYRLGHYAGGRRVGLLAAGLLALARLHIWWSQDIKNYTLAGIFTLLSIWLTLRLWESAGARPARRGWLWAGYVATSALGLYSHYLAALIFVANNLFAGLWVLMTWRRRPGRVTGRTLTEWVLAQAAVLGLFAPWLMLYVRQATDWAAAPPVPPGLFVHLAATLYALGVVHHIERYTALVLVLATLAGWGALMAGRRPGTRRHAAALLSVLIVVLPPIVVYGLALVPEAIFAPQITPRYLLIFSPAFLLLLALGLGALFGRSRRVGLTALIVVVTAQTWTLTDYYRARRWSDDLYTLTNVINNFAQAGDGVLLHTDHDWPVFVYYLRAPVSWDGILAGHLVDEATAAARAETMVSRFERVWVVVDADALAKDPGHRVEAALALRLPKQFEAHYGDRKLLLYAAEPERALEVPAPNFRPQIKRSVTFAPGLTLLGFDFPQTEAHMGDELYLVTYWQTSQAAQVQVALVDPRGTPADAEARTVPAGTRVRLETELGLPPAAEGVYAVQVTAGSLTATLDHVTAAPLIAPRQPAIDTPTGYRLGDSIELAGFDLPRGQARPGESVAVTLFWQGSAPVQASYKVFVHLVGSEWNTAQDNPLWGQVDRLPLDGSLPTDAWLPGEVVADAYHVPVDPAAPPGRYRLTVGLYDGLSGQRLPVYDGAGIPLGDEIILAEIEILAQD